MPIGLGVAWSGIIELDPPLPAKVLELMADELRAIVGDYLFWYAEAAYHILPDEIFDFSVTDLVLCINFHPFGEVVRDWEHVYSLAGSCRKLPHNVHTPFHEGLWR